MFPYIFICYIFIYDLLLFYYNLCTIHTAEVLFVRQFYSGSCDFFSPSVRIVGPGWIGLKTFGENTWNDVQGSLT